MKVVNLLIYLLIGISINLAQTYVPGEVLVKCNYDVINFPQNRLIASINEISINSEKLQSLFTDLQVDSIFKVVPFAIRGDTIRILSDGTVLKLEDFSLLFKITFSLKINIDSMVTKLSRIPDVFYAEPNQYLYPGVDPDDPAYENADQWYLKQSSDQLFLIICRVTYQTQ